MVKLKDIAERCGVSTATVSKALNDLKDVSEEKKEYIKNVARQMGYTPNAVARSLRTRRSHNIGVLFVDEMRSGLAHEYFSLVLNSLKDTAEELGYDITFITSSIGGRNISYVEHCRYRNCDGVVIACVNFDDPMVQELIDSDIPTVTIDKWYPDNSAIMSDNARGMEDLVKYIHMKGHEKIAFIYGEDTYVTRKRVESFTRTLDYYGIKIPQDYMIRAKYHDADLSGKATKFLLSIDESPTCIIYPDDISALGGISEIEKAGLRIPDDISIAGYDGVKLSQIIRPKLTTLRQDTKKLGEEAAIALTEQIESDCTAVTKQYYVVGKLLEGESVKAI